MIRRSTFMSLIVIGIVGAILFRVKYEVMALEQRHRQVKKETQESLESLHVLKAEWAHLNEPTKLQALAHKYLGDLSPVKGSQLVSFDHVMSNVKGYDSKALGALIEKAASESKSNIPDSD